MSRAQGSTRPAFRLRAPRHELPTPAGRARLALVTWNQVVLLGLGVLVASILLGRGSRTASEASLERRCRWAIRLALGYGAVLLLALLVPLGRFAWAAWGDTSSSMEERTLLLSVCLASAMNLVLGFLIFGLAPTMVAFMVARRLERTQEAPFRG
jgi:Kef-type K+ transport system membrane component KefB